MVEVKRIKAPSDIPAQGKLLPRDPITDVVESTP